MPEILLGNAFDTILNNLKEKSFDCCFTGPNPVFYRMDVKDNKDVIGSQHNTHDYVYALVKIFGAVKYALKDSGSLFVQMGDYYDKVTGGLRCTPELFCLIMQRDGWILTGKLVWKRTENKKIKRGPEHGFVKDWEYLFHFVKADQEYYFDTNSNKYWKSSVIEAPLSDGFFTNEFDSGFPEKLIEIALKTTTKEGDHILDPMAGAGTVGIVAKKMNRDFTLIDIDPKIVELLRIRLKI